MYKYTHRWNHYKMIPSSITRDDDSSGGIHLGEGSRQMRGSTLLILGFFGGKISGHMHPIGMADHSLFTLLGTNISPEMSVLKMIFLFPRWDMLISWRVFQFVDWFFFKSSFVLYNVKVLRVGLQVRIITRDHNRLAVQWLVGGLGPSGALDSERILLWKGLLLTSTSRIPNHRGPKLQDFTT